MHLKRQARPEHSTTWKKGWQTAKMDAESFLNMISLQEEPSGYASRIAKKLFTPIANIFSLETISLLIKIKQKF